MTPDGQLSDVDKAVYITELERLSTSQLLGRWIGETDEVQRLIDAHVDTGILGAEILAQSLAIHEWRRDTIQALYDQRQRINAATAVASVSIPHSGNGHSEYKEIAQLPQSDAGNAEAFTRLFQDVVRFDHRRRKWLLWQSPNWKTDVDGEIERLALHAIRERGAESFRNIEDKEERKRAVKWASASESRQKLKAMIEMAASMRPLADQGTAWDSNDWLLGCENGAVDLHEGTRKEGDPADRITLSTGVRYDEAAHCPRWFQFLDEIFKDEKLIEYVQRAIGYSLTGDISEQVLFVCHGKGANGKSVFLAILRAILGDYSCNTPFSTFEMIDRNGATNDVAALAGRRLITSSETRENARLNEARVKALTGGDPVTARFLFGEYFTFSPKGKIWLAVNHRPKVSDDSYGFWRRVRLIPFTQTFGPDRADPHLTEKLLDELPGILTWAVFGCLDWQREGLQAPEIVTRATDEYRTDSDPLARFIDERCTLSAEKQIMSTDLLKAYKEWAAECGEKEMSGQALGRRLADKDIEKKRERDETGKQKTFYKGIGLS